VSLLQLILQLFIVLINIFMNRQLFSNEIMLTYNMSLLLSAVKESCDWFVANYETARK